MVDELPDATGDITNATNCNETLRELETFLDDELTDDARGAIRSHLEGCTDCLQAFDFQAELKSVIATKCHSDEMPPGLMQRIERCFDLEPEA